MREILFRGKRIDNGEWVEGQYAYLLNPRTKDGEPIKHMIIDGTPFGQPIEISTLGQYTGLADKNGKRIFERDIVETYHYSTLMEIRWNEQTASFELWRQDTWYGQIHMFNLVKVLGNVFDNLELLEGNRDG